MEEQGRQANKPVRVQATGREDVRKLLASLREAFPDAKFSLESRVKDDKGGDLAFVFSGTGTHRGEVGGVPATGTPAKIVVVSRVTGRAGESAS